MLPVKKGEKIRIEPKNNGKNQVLATGGKTIKDLKIQEMGSGGRFI